ncbi:AP endonuclease, family 2 [Treponema primitia ZAS-2]|uniref:AP endonuclease, family 2 n=1 Tax=Treponema primitia (strain ATCC BAA-887 / DSM 12427 / ZAS-2) TaxID=545694 RepID=F5YQW8_TREPZ|nr:sugar phosphate isomerase/epimerase family protein [Treponema primitia]AEF85819.1 AP endonuclease, family 2 [Treponema primitia ZAS-2]
MKLSILPVSFFAKINAGEISIAEWAAHAQKLGVDGYDISIMFIPNHTATLINRLKEESKNAGITIQPFMVCTYPDFTNPDALERDRQIDYLKRDIALVSDLGFQYMRITAGMNHPGLGIEEGAKRCVDCFSKVTDTAQKYGVKLVFENHSKPGAWPLIDFSFNPEAFLAVAEKIQDLPVGINFDTANAVACGANAVELLQKVIKKVWTVHLNDTSTVGKWTPIQIGQGLVDYDGIFKVLKDNKFDGWVAIEEASGNGWKGIDDAVAFARKYV